MIIGVGLLGFYQKIPILSVCIIIVVPFYISYYVSFRFKNLCLLEHYGTNFYNLLTHNGTE